MKKKFRELTIRFLVWIGWVAGLWKNLLNSKKALENKDIKTEFIYLIEVCYFTGLDKEYLRLSVKNRIIASILLILRRCSKKPEFIKITKDPEILKEAIEKCLDIKIEITELGYRCGLLSQPIWILEMPKEEKRCLELLDICLAKTNQGE